jgi:hypothetical protein
MPKSPCITHSAPYPSPIGSPTNFADEAIKIVTIRPQIGVGSAVILGEPRRTSGPYVEPGVTGLVSFGLVFVGIDAKLAFLPHSTTVSSGDAFTIHGQLGVKF